MAGRQQEGPVGTEVEPIHAGVFHGHVEWGERVELPDVDFRPGAGDERSVGRDVDVANRAVVALIAGEDVAGLDVEDLHRGVRAPRDEPRSIGCESHVSDLAIVAGVGHHQLARLEVPCTYARVGSRLGIEHADGEQPIVRAELDVEQRRDAGRGLQSAQFLSTFCVPHSDEALDAATVDLALPGQRDHRAVTAELGDEADGVFADPNFAFEFSGLGIPDPDRPFVVARCDPLAVRADCRIGDPLATDVQRV